MEIAATHLHIGKRFSGLAPAQRRAVYQKIRAEGLAIGQFPILARDTAAQARCPASYAQLRQWFLWQLEPGSSAYHISGGLKLRGLLDREALQASFDALLERHESLRTVFQADAEGHVEQLVRERMALEIPFTDLSGIDAEVREARAREAAVRLAETPFDLTAGPLLRVALIRLAEGEHLLVVVMHHIVSDGWSMQVLVDEFAAQYRARAAGQTKPSPPRTPCGVTRRVWYRRWDTSRRDSRGSR